MSRKLKVLIVLPSGGRHGGVEAFGLAIAHQLTSETDIEVRVVFRLMKGWPLDEKFARWLEDTCPFPTTILLKPSFEIFKHIWWADVVNCHFPLIDVALPTRLLGKKLCLSIENRRCPDHHFLHRLGLSAGHCRWYISKFVKKTWENDRPLAHSHVIPAISELPAKVVPPERRTGFIFIARWVAKKGLEELVAAYLAARIDHARHPLTLVGEGPLEQTVYSQIRAAPSTIPIITKGFVSVADKEILLAKSRWNVAPAQFEEDLGLTPIEARACRVPSIVTSIGGLPEAGGPAALVCEPYSVDDLQRAIEEAAHMSDEDYHHRSNLAFESLSTYLAATNFYAIEFRRIVSRPTS